ncbi:MAG: RES family NAD+ phosphorylase [Gemmataceae bacterium]
MNTGACGQLARVSLTGTWFRAIQPQYWQTSLQTAHTRTIPGRFNAGSQTAPGFEILYLSENPMVALIEVEALFGSPMSAGGAIANPRHAWLIINVEVQLQQVADLTDVPGAQDHLQTSAQELTGDWRGYQQRSPQTSVTTPTGLAPTQELGQSLYGLANLEAFQTLSVRLPYHRNVVIFPQKLVAGSRIRFVHPATGQVHTIPSP